MRLEVKHVLFLITSIYVELLCCKMLLMNIASPLECYIIID
jgi:hypothetical protein